MEEEAAPGLLHQVVFVVNTSSEVTRLSAVGNCPQLGSWGLEGSVLLTYDEATGNVDGSCTWRSPPLRFAPEQFPLRFRLAANGHRSSPNTRPLIWDSASRAIYTPPKDGEYRCEFEPTPDNSDTGWVTTAGVGAFQLRVGQPPGSTEPLVQLEPGVAGGARYRVDLFEARGNDPAVPAGKTFACLTCGDVGLLETGLSPRSQRDSLTYLMNSQSLEALAFRVDVISEPEGRLLARGFVPHQALAGLEGTVTAALITPDMQQAGTFRAAFLVVTALPCPHNNLGNLQRTRWKPDGPTLDIGHRGSGASKVRGHSVRENTLLSFQKAATNHTDFIEFDVHLTADGEAVIYHDYEIKLALGHEVVQLAIPLLQYRQLQSPDFTHYLIQPASEDRGMGALGEAKARRGRGLQRAMSSGEDMLRAVLKPHMGEDGPTSASGLLGGGAEAATPPAVRWFLADRIATLREAFRRTPKWLGFNLELKYPTVAEVAAMRAVYYSRNTFVDAVLRVVLEEARGRKVIFSTFDPDCATLLSLKQPRYPVFFLTCGGTKLFADPRMNSLEAAMQFAISSHLQGVVAEASSVLNQLDKVVAEFHRHGLFLFTWGDSNNDIEHYLAQKQAGLDGIIFDDVAKVAKATNKQFSLFNKPLKSPVSQRDLEALAAGEAAPAVGLTSASAPDLDRLPSAVTPIHQVQVLAIQPITSPK